MSHIIKRNAEEAFKDQNHDDKKAKKRRVRSKASIHGDEVAAITAQKPIEKTEDRSAQDPAPIERSATPKHRRSRKQKIVVEVGTQKTPSIDDSPHESKRTSIIKELGQPGELPVRRTVDSVPDVALNTLISTAIKKNKKQKSKHRNTKQDLYHSSWNLSQSSGGLFLNQDPILTLDGQYVVMPTKRDVQIYSTSTSLLVRSIPVNDASSIICCALSLSESNHLLVALSGGLIARYDFSTGRKTDQWQTQPGLTSLTSVPSNDKKEIFFATRSISGQDETLLLMTCTAGTSKIASTVVLQQNSLQRTIISSEDGSVLMAFSHSKIHVGYAASQDKDSISGQTYDWKELAVPGRIVSYDARIRQDSSNSRKILPSVNVAVGLQNGAIMVFTDVLTKLVAKQKGSSNDEMRGRRLHWHRNAVRSVKWSRDGNYLISGGDESVLVIWQLDTNQEQYLPHLSTSILNITVSQSGAHYALRLGDNSVMVLSTADLTPSTNISALSLGSMRPVSSTILLHPTEPNRLFAAVPARTIGQSSKVATHLQVFDIDTNIQLSKQALTRNMTTTVNIGPSGDTIHEPNLAYMNISRDGKWLATIDEWSPSPAQAKEMYLEDTESERSSLHETTLRFWSYDTESQGWVQITRVDEPHPASKHNVLAMAANPYALEFTTMGIDGSLKVWSPRTRVRDGVAVRNKAGEILYSWSCSRQLQVEQDLTYSDQLAPVSGALAYSADGSVLAASWSSASTVQRYVHFIDPKTGITSLSQPHILTPGPSTLSFSGRFLLALSQDLTIFDTVSLQSTFVMAFDAKFKQSDSEAPNKFLVVNPNTNTFVVAGNSTPSADSKRALPSNISVFNVDSAAQGPIAEFGIRGPLQTILADSNTGEFIVIDRESSIRRITPPGNAVANSMALSTKTEVRMQIGAISAGKCVAEIMGRHEPSQDQAANGSESRGLLESPLAVDARSLSLEDLFETSNTATAPGIEQLFERVAKAVVSVRVSA